VKRSFAASAVLLLAACAAQPQPEPTPVASVARGTGVPPQFQYLYGSGEAGAVSQQVFASLLKYVRIAIAERPRDSVVLASGAQLDGPFVPCGSKPIAVVFDIDETVLLNLGYEYGDALNAREYDAARWDRWERTGTDAVVAPPGAVFTLDELRRIGVTIVFNSNRSAANATATALALKKAYLGSAKHGETLFLKGDDASGSRKDGRRATIAERYCVVAMVGDQLGDFSDAFGAIESPAKRRDVATETTAQKWGNGWFLLPNPVYGSALKGDFDDVFPTDKRWTDPGPSKEQ
jgi:5'-nucleotidase (lipoprotein e(P4) family)